MSAKRGVEVTAGVRPPLRILLTMFFLQCLATWRGAVPRFDLAWFSFGSHLNSRVGWLGVVERGQGGGVVCLRGVSFVRLQGCRLSAAG